MEGFINEDSLMSSSGDSSDETENENHHHQHHLMQQQQHQMYNQNDNTIPHLMNDMEAPQHINNFHQMNHYQQQHHHLLQNQQSYQDNNQNQDDNSSPYSPLQQNPTITNVTATGLSNTIPNTPAHHLIQGSSAMNYMMAHYSTPSNQQNPPPPQMLQATVIPVAVRFFSLNSLNKVIFKI